MRSLLLVFRIPCLLLAFLFYAEHAVANEYCSYQTYQWNVHERKAVKRHTVRHLYSELTEFEIDRATGCTVCQEDQVEIRIKGLVPFKVCHLLAPKLQPLLVDLLERQEPIFRIEGYRVGKTRGDLDAQGNRTDFSHHSFGIAIDVNPEMNGLYDQCIEFSQYCRLIKGGEWKRGHIGSLTADSVIVQAMESIGLQWGGRILGQQKDFMHFSPSGY